MNALQHSGGDSIKPSLGLKNSNGSIADINPVSLKVNAPANQIKGFITEEDEGTGTFGDEHLSTEPQQLKYENPYQVIISGMLNTVGRRGESEADSDRYLGQYIDDQIYRGNRLIMSREEDLRNLVAEATEPTVAYKRTEVLSAIGQTEDDQGDWEALGEASKSSVES